MAKPNPSWPMRDARMDDDAVADQRVLDDWRSAPMKQSRPIATASPMTAPAEMTVPRPISARAPTTAPGSTRDAVLQRASGCTVPPTSRPSPKKPDGPQRRGIGAREIEAVGAVGLRRLQHRDVLAEPGRRSAPGRGRPPRASSARCFTYFGLSRKLRSPSLAVSSGAAPAIDRVGIAAQQPRADELRDLGKTQRRRRRKEAGVTHRRRPTKPAGAIAAGRDAIRSACRRRTGRTASRRSLPRSAHRRSRRGAARAARPRGSSRRPRSGSTHRRSTITGRAEIGCR